MTEAFRPGNVWKSKDASKTVVVVQEFEDHVVVHNHDTGLETDISAEDMVKNYVLVEDSL